MNYSVLVISIFVIMFVLIVIMIFVIYIKSDYNVMDKDVNIECENNAREIIRYMKRLLSISISELKTMTGTPAALEWFEDNCNLDDLTRGTKRDLLELRHDMEQFRYDFR